MLAVAMAVAVADVGAVSDCFFIPEIEVLIDLGNPPTHPPRLIDR